MKNCGKAFPRIKEHSQIGYLYILKSIFLWEYFIGVHTAGKGGVGYW
jgi:hypothetical protein